MTRSQYMLPSKQMRFIHVISFSSTCGSLLICKTTFSMKWHVLLTLTISAIEMNYVRCKFFRARSSCLTPKHTLKCWLGIWKKIRIFISHYLQKWTTKSPNEENHRKKIRDKYFYNFPDKSPILIQSFGVVRNINADGGHKCPVDYSDNSELCLPVPVKVEVFSR